VMAAQSFPGVTIRQGNTDYASPVHMANKSRDDDLSLTVEKRWGDYTFSSVTAKQKEKINAVQDITAQAVYFLDALRAAALPAPPIGPALFNNTASIAVTPKSLSQEFKVSSPIERDISVVAGLFHANVDVTQDALRDMFVNTKIDHVTSRTQTTGLYGRTTWTLGADTSLLTGLRYNRDRVDYSITDKANNWASAASDTANTIAGDLTLRRKLGQDHMVYGTYSHGYKPRAFNTAATLTSNTALKPVDKEDIDHVELGDKSVLLGGALTLSQLPLRLTLNAQYAYRTAALLQGNQNPLTRQAAFGILNLGITAAPESGKYQVTAFVNNALNKFYLVNAEDFFSGLYAVPGSPPGAVNAVVGQPARDARRYLGLRLNHYFD
jgi:iron complex outermembrane receptor protein